MHTHRRLAFIAFSGGIYGPLTLCVDTVLVGYRLRAHHLVLSFFADAAY